MQNFTSKILNGFQKPSLPDDIKFTLMVDHRRLNPDRRHPWYFVSNYLTIHDEFGNYIPQPGVQVGELSLPYISKCWHCGALISSQFCKRSIKNWNFGFECKHCGEDLEKIFQSSPHPTRTLYLVK